MDQDTVAVTVRLATRHDLAAIRGMFNHYIVNSTCTFHLEPLTEEEHRAWFEERDPAKHPVTVAVAGEEVLGWAALSAWKSRCAYANSAEGSVYVRPDVQRRGIGSALMRDLIDRARAGGLRTIIGGTCTEHANSLALQKRFGFAEVGTFRQVGLKFGRWLDVAYMQLILDER